MKLREVAEEGSSGRSLIAHYHTDRKRRLTNRHTSPCLTSSHLITNSPKDHRSTRSTSSLANEAGGDKTLQYKHMVAPTRSYSKRYCSLNFVGGCLLFYFDTGQTRSRWQTIQGLLQHEPNILIGQVNHTVNHSTIRRLALRHSSRAAD